MKCNECGWDQMISLSEYRQFIDLDRLACSNCNSNQKCEAKLIGNWGSSAFHSEDELQFHVMNAFIKRGIKVWDCVGEVGRCPDPILIDDIPMRITVGDFPFYWGKKYRIMELKLQKYRCRKERDQKYYPAKSSVLLYNPQIDLLLEGGGFLMIVSEPSLRSLGIKGLNSEIKVECEGFLEDRFRNYIQLDEILYNTYLINQERFQILWDDILKNKKTYTDQRRGRPRLHKKLSIIELEKLIPKSKIELSLNIFRHGNFIDLILDLIY